MLEIKNISVFYGRLQAIWDLSIEIRDGDCLTILGSNGAGKTTLLTAISGLIRPATGSISYNEVRIDRMEPHKICELGIVQIPQGRHIFPMMSVIENLEMGAYMAKARKKAKQNLERIFAAYPVLKQRSGQLAGTLSGGEQQMLAIGRGLMSDPELLMLDEPTLGLSPKLALDMLGSIKNLHEQGLTLAVVSQETMQCLKITERAYVLENGRVALEGKCSALLLDDKVRKAYMGI
jgi:branched-chain amino acid transport system ATP-binding protein